MNAQKIQHPFLFLVCLCLLAIAAFFIFGSRSVYAAVLSVSSTLGNDMGDCQINPCKTIGYAINQASNGDTIIVASGIYTDLLNLDKNITLNGAGVGNTIIDGTGNVGIGCRLVRVWHNTIVNISGVTFQNGLCNIKNYGHLILNSSSFISITSDFEEAGAIHNDSSGTLTITNSTIMNNESGRYGGGMLNAGILILNNVTISNNRAYEGGGILNSGAMTITNSGISNNIARVTAGGIQNHGTATISNTTIISNAGFSSSGGIYNLGTASLLSVTLTQNNGHFYGGGIHNGNILILSASTVSTNTAQAGAGISNYGTLTMTAGSVAGNIAQQAYGGFMNTGILNISQVLICGNIAQTASGGGIGTGKDYQQKGIVRLTDVTISNNVAQGTGGGIFNKDGVLIATNTTVSGNSAPTIAGIDNSGQITLTNVTINNNQVIQLSGLAASIYNGYNSTSVVYLKNTIVANDGSFPNCKSDMGIGIISLGNNLNSDNTCNLTSTGDLTNTNPFLGPLANNGGATLTHALLTGSPAIDKGTNIGCPPTDQRGMPRPLGARCDIGAYEFSDTYPFALILPVIRK
jgi:hypothetical protein